MRDLEKIIRGLECCYNAICGACPYSANRNCQHELHGDALALLKEQEQPKEKNKVRRKHETNSH